MIKRVAELVLEFDPRAVKSDVDEIESDIEALSDIEVKPMLDDGAIMNALDDLRSQRASIIVDAKADRAETRRLKSELESQLADIEADVDLDTAEAETRAEQLRTAIRNLEIKAELDDQEARADVRSLDSLIKDLQQDFDIGSNTSEAEARVSGLRRQIESLNQTVDIDADTGQAGQSIDELKQEAGDGFSIPVSIPTGALEGLTSSVATALSPAALGLVGIGTAIAGGLTAGFLEGLNREAQVDVVAARLGLSPEESERFGEASGRLYAQAYGESTEEVNAALQGIVETGLLNIETASREAFNTAGAAALDLARILDTDVNEVTRVASQLLRSGLASSAEEAFDLIAAGAQEGANQSGQLLETVNEFAINFAEAGFTGEQALSTIAQTADTATFDLTKVGDLIKEAGIQLAELDEGRLEIVSEATGLAADEIQRLADQAKAGNNISFLRLIDEIKNVEDQSARSRAAVELFGTPFEDLTNSTFLQIDFGAELENIAGAAERAGNTLNDNLLTRLEAIRREGFDRLIQVGNAALLPLLDALVPVFDALAAAGERLSTGLSLGLSGDFFEGDFGEEPISEFLRIGVQIGEFLTSAQETISLFTTAFRAGFSGISVEDAQANLEPFGVQLSEIATVGIDLGLIFRDEIIPAFQDFGAFLSEDLFPALQETGAAIAEDFGPILTERVIPIVADAARIFQEDLLPVLQEFALFVVEDVVPPVSDIAETMAFFATEIISELVLPAVESLVEIFGEEVQPVLEQDVIPLLEILAEELEKAEPKFAIVVDVIQLGLIPALEFMVRTFINVASSVIRVITGLVETIRGLLSGDIDQILSGLRTQWEGIIGIFTAPFESVIRIFGDQIGRIEDIWSGAFDRIDGAIDPVLNAVQDLIDLIRRIPSSIPNPFANISVPNLSGLPGFAFGGVTREPSFITSEYGHEEVIFPGAASIDRIKTIMAQSSYDVLGRLYADYESRRGTSIITPSTTSTTHGGNVFNITVEDRGGRSKAARVQTANLIPSAIERRLIGAL